MTNFAFRAATLLAVVLSLSGSTAHAYSTRVHIVVANELRESLIASGDGSITLRWSGVTTQIPQADADAIVNQPLAFRAGVIGPDSFVFPGMTDGTHGVEQDPFRQCQLLYEDAVTEEEIAYALGCFVHGTGDVTAHHFVNYISGETFTLNPAAASRTSSFVNVVAHIVTESAIQTAVYESGPSDLGAGPLSLAMPRGFISRTYHNNDSPLWQLMARHAVGRIDAARTAAPDATLLEIVSSIELAPYEQLMLAPLYVDALQDTREDIRAFIVSEIEDMQDPFSVRGSDLLVGPGPDGMLSTADDTTDCSATCPIDSATYFTYVNMLLPRRDAGGRELESAFDKISDKLGDDLNLFLPSLLETIERLVVQLNAPITDGGDHGFDVDLADVAFVFGPMDDWVNDIAAIDYETIARAVTPAWYQNLSDFFSSIGVSISVADILESLLQPLVDDVRQLIRDRVVAEADTYLRDLIDQYDDGLEFWEGEVTTRLTESTPPGATGHALDQIRNSGLWVYTFNLAAVTLANHENVLTPGDPIESGPASFDASHTHRWTQVGLCDYLRPAVFPEGMDIGAFLSVEEGGEIMRSPATDDAPVECHGGSADEFGTPSIENCRHASLEELLATGTGSISRSFPPEFAEIGPACRNIIIPGLPDPPPTPDGGGVDGGPGVDAGPGVDGGPGVDSGMMGGGGGDCGCAVPGTGRGDGAGWLALVGLALLGWRRSRRKRRSAFAPLALGALLVLGACGDDDGATDAGADSTVMDGGEDTGTDAGSDSGADSSTDTSVPDTGEDTATDTGPDLRRQLLDALGSSVWNATAERSEGPMLVERGYEMRFEAGSLEWAEIRNPFGPSRLRTLRSFSVMPDGLTIESIILSPAGWPPHPRNGERQTWEIEVVDGDPRMLRLTDTEIGATEVYTEGVWPEPTEGLTAEVRVFGPSGSAWDAFCGAGVNLDDSERRIFWTFARGESATPVLGYDIVAGARLEEWDDSAPGANDFGVTDIHGFDQLGGTMLSDQFNFAVRYTGTIQHPGGTFDMQEVGDDLEDAVWVFIGDGVGGDARSDLFLEVHNWFSANATPNPASTTLGAGDVPIEIILVRCAMPFAGESMRTEINLGAGGYELVGDAPSDPLIDATLFPPAL